MGAAGALAGGMGGGPGAFIGAALALGRTLSQLEHERLTTIRRGGAALSPGGAATEVESEKLSIMMLARHQGETARQRAAAYLKQLQAQARDLPGSARLTEGQDIEFSSRQSFFTVGNAANLVLQMQRWTDPLAWIKPTQYATKEAEQRGEFYRQWIKEHGGKPESFKESNPLTALGVESGFTTGLQYQQELQVGLLQTDEVQSKVLQEQLKEAIGNLTAELVKATGVFSNLVPGWGG